MASTASKQMVLHGYRLTDVATVRVPGERARWKLPVAWRSEIPGVVERRLGDRMLGVVRPVLVVLVVGCGAASASMASEPGRSGERGDEVLASLVSEGLIVAWVAMVAALSALYRLRDDARAREQFDGASCRATAPARAQRCVRPSADQLARHGAARGGAYRGNTCGPSRAGQGVEGSIRPGSGGDNQAAQPSAPAAQASQGEDAGRRDRGRRSG